jgi:hypothetical protein
MSRRIVTMHTQKTGCLAINGPKSDDECIASQLEIIHIDAATSEGLKIYSLFSASSYNPSSNQHKAFLKSTRDQTHRKHLPVQLACLDPTPTLHTDMWVIKLKKVQRPKTQDLTP